MKTKKLLALLLAVSMMAVSATTTGFAEEENNLVDISSSAVMSTNGNDYYWPVSQAVDGVYFENDADTTTDSTLAGFYATDDSCYLQADVGSAQFIRAITVINTHSWGSYGAGRVKNIQLSNDPNFATYEEMTCVERILPDGTYDDGTVFSETRDHKSMWKYEGNMVYRYVRVYGTPGHLKSISDADPNNAFVIQDMMIYAEEQEDVVLADISSTAKMSSSIAADAYNPWPISQAIDGNLETTAGVYNATEQSYIQADFGRTQDIKSITVTNANQWGWTGTGKARAIHLSNDPAFGTYEEMICYQRINDENANSDYVDYKSEWLYTGKGSYRYARIYPTPAGASYTNWGDDTTPSFAIKELNVFATEKSADLLNVISGKTPTLTNGDWMFETSGTNLVDGNNGTVTYAASALAVFELDQHMDIEKVEIDLRADGEVTDADRHYEVYLSNTGTKEGALKILGVEENHQQIPYNTIVLPVDSTYGYKYVLVGSESNFWGLTEVRVMSNGEYAAPETPEIPEEPTEEIEIEVVNMGTYEGKAWDVVINNFDGAKAYTAVFTDEAETKSGEIGFENVEADGGSVAFAIFLHTSRASVALDITME